jgi:hypothetical protein
MASFQLAQVNLAYALGDETDSVMATFMAQLDEINTLADRSPGFVWRYLSDSRDPAQRELADPRVLFNLSVWSSIEALHAFTYRTAHGKVFAERKRWFAEWKEHVHRLPELGADAPFVALWWVPEGQRPTPAEALERLRMLGARGPGPQAFTFKRPFSPAGLPLER